MGQSYIFTSESVSEGHPDKIADQISDAILDAILTHDKNARVACETLITTNLVLIAGEITTLNQPDYTAIIRKTIRDIGYNHVDLGFDADNCSIIISLDKQSPDISQGIKAGATKRQGAGDQGLMFGYACSETKSFMPFPIDSAHKLMRKQAAVRKSNQIPWLRPDAKCQISARYYENEPPKVETVVFSTQHNPEISQKEIEEAVIEEIIKPTIPKSSISSNIRYLINPTGKFVTGGPVGDCGLTGRKIIVDTYGGIARHGGGAFSGKDPSKVDRSASYAMRYIAKNIVAAEIAKKCELQISYAIGVADPISIMTETFGTGIIKDSEITQLIYDNFDLTPQGIIKELDLCRPIYKQTASYGHFGQDKFPWEQTNKASILKKAATKYQ